MISIRDPSALQEVGALFAAVMAGPAPPSLANCLNCREYCCACRLIARAASGDEEGVQGCSPEHRAAAGASFLSAASCCLWSFGRSSYERLLPLQRWRAQRSMEAFVPDRERGGPDGPQPPEHQPWPRRGSPLLRVGIPGGRKAPCLVPVLLSHRNVPCPLPPSTSPLSNAEPGIWRLRVPRRLLLLNLRNISKLLSRLWLI